MSTAPELHAVLRREGNEATVRFADGSKRHLGRETIARSNVLRQAIFESDGSSDSSILLPESEVRNWLTGLELQQAMRSPFNDKPELDATVGTKRIGYLQVILKYDNLYVCVRAPSVCSAESAPPVRDLENYACTSRFLVRESFLRACLVL